MMMRMNNNESHITTIISKEELPTNGISMRRSIVGPPPTPPVCINAVSSCECRWHDARRRKVQTGSNRHAWWTSEWTDFLDFRAATYLSNASCDRCILVQWSCAICLKSWINTWNDNILVSFRGGQSSQASWTSDAKAASILCDLCEVALRPRTPWNQRLVRPASDLPSDNETVCHGKWPFSLDDTSLFIYKC